MRPTGPDFWTISFFVMSVTFVTTMAWRGWRLGLVRQALSIVGIAGAYAAGFFGGKFLLPFLRPLGFPDKVLIVLGGVILGLIVYIGMAAVSGLLFKRTEHQSLGVLRLGFGLSGAVLGAVFGLFLVFFSAVSIRLLGSLAEHEVAGHPSKRSVNPLATRLATIKHSLEQGATGYVLEKVDPVPPDVYSALGKVGQLVADPEHMQRFAENPAVKSLSTHPKIVALQSDPEVVKAAEALDLMALLRNPRVVEAANDPEVIKLMGTFDLQKALDFALQPSQKPAPKR